MVKMRLWSIHPKYLDSIGLIALWRETLLAKKVLQKKTKGYKNHPQLIRFKEQKSPLNAINNYLHFILMEAKKRGFKFDERKAGIKTKINKIPITKGQIEFEFKWFKLKLRKRNPEKLKELKKIIKIESNPLFKVIKGKKENWEKSK
jgi:hypothetical protein